MERVEKRKLGFPRSLAFMAILCFGIHLSNLDARNLGKTAEWPLSTKSKICLSKYDKASQDTLYNLVMRGIEKQEHLLSLSAMDSLMAIRPAKGDSLLRFPFEQIYILEFIQNGCGAYIVPIGAQICSPMHNRYIPMTPETFEYFRKWYRCNRKFISEKFVRFYLLLMQERFIPKDFSRRYPDLDQELLNIYFRHVNSLHCMFQWYVQGGDLNSLPPQNVIDIGDVFYEY